MDRKECRRHTARAGQRAGDDRCFARSSAGPVRNDLGWQEHSEQDRPLLRLTVTGSQYAFIMRKVHETELYIGKWIEVKTDAAECFRSWGKCRARKERAEIRIISGEILLSSRPETPGPGIASAMLRKELRVALQRRRDGLKAVARAERCEVEALCSRTILR
ncbi:hypothetical protein MRX96_048542 [Rhipicephalus microplus]